MIKVTVKEKSIKIEGHALFDEHGKDIVCSSVSSIVTTSVNACLTFDKKSIKYVVKKGLVKITILKKYISEYQPEYAIRFSRRGYRKDGFITNLPLYLARKTKELL